MVCDSAQMVVAEKSDHRWVAAGSPGFLFVEGALCLMLMASFTHLDQDLLKAGQNVAIVSNCTTFYFII